MIQLIKNKIAVTPIFDPDMSPSGLLYIPDIAKERCDQGIVKYLGPECVDAKVGDYVLFSGYTGTLLQLEGEGLLIIFPEDFVVARVHTPVTDIPGLYFQDYDGNYFTATYEQAMGLIAKAFEEADWHSTLQVNYKDKFRDRPTLEDYDKLKGG